MNDLNALSDYREIEMHCSRYPDTRTLILYALAYLTISTTPATVLGTKVNLGTFSTLRPQFWNFAFL